MITFNKALQLQDAAESIFAHNEFDVSSSQVLALVNNSHCSSYDCEFVALAHYLNTTLITQDQKILNEFPSTAISISNFLSHI
jgi:predicted nucleic acid-binding protein